MSIGTAIVTPVPLAMTGLGLAQAPHSPPRDPPAVTSLIAKPGALPGNTVPAGPVSVIVDAPAPKLPVSPGFKAPEGEVVKVTVYCTRVAPSAVLEGTTETAPGADADTNPSGTATGVVSAEVETARLPPVPEPVVTP
jgi:hypothetical protein